ncbi:MAG: DUF349 domain-containing protein [Bacteroidales bacterium]|nr:DUF349 domain-containing protein [Bacteroidales bacterium]
MEYSDKNEHLNDDPLENTKNKHDASTGDTHDELNEKASAAPDQAADKDDHAGGSPEKKLPDSELPPGKEKPSPGKEKPSPDTQQPVREAPSAEKKAEEPKVNYALLSKDDLVKLFEEKLNEASFDKVRFIADEIQQIYEQKLEEEIAAKKDKFIEEGGQELDFKPVEEPVDKKMSELIEKYRTLKSDFNKHLEDEKESNLAAKHEVLEEFRVLMEQQEGFDNTFRKFKQLQKRWFDIGIVPKQNVRDLWNSYNFFVDKFNDYVSINKELRVLDLKKNLEKKEALCEKAEGLTKEPNISTAFKILQTLHAQWKEIGPVPREEKDAIWMRFKAATSVINKAHQNFQTELKDSLVENLQLKTNLCERAEVLAEKELKSHKEWAENTRDLLKIQKEWKGIGYAPKKENNRIYARFRKACDAFFEKKAAFYAETLEHQKESLEEKKSIVEEAERLKDSTDWRKTTDRLIELQQQWKESGPVPRRESDKLWKRLRTACDHFFHSKSDFFSGKNEAYEENLVAKEELIRKLSELSPPANIHELVRVLEDYQDKYNAIGFVPVESKDKIRDEFKDAINNVVDRLDIESNEKSLIRYRLKIMAILSGPKGENKLNYERDRMMNKLQQLRSDIGIWENNIGFFKETESAEETISDFQEKIESAHLRIDLLERKIGVIDELSDG